MMRLDPCTVARLGEAKGLDAHYLRATFGLYDRSWYSTRAIAIPYRDADGAVLFEKLRLPDGTARRDPVGANSALYGLDRLATLSPQAQLLIVEGESDVWAAWTHNVAAIGVPGATSWRSEWVPFLRDYRCIIWEEPDTAGEKFVLAVSRDLPSALVIAGDATDKDACALHQRVGARFADELAGRIQRAVPIRARAAAIAGKTPPHHPRVTPRAYVGGHDTGTSDALIESARRKPLDALFESLGLHVIGRGTQRTMRCPFHEDGTPSLSVNMARGVWYCHGCGASGDGIAFVQRLKGLDFPAAVREVAS